MRGRVVRKVLRQGATTPLFSLVCVGLIPFAVTPFGMGCVRVSLAMPVRDVAEMACVGTARTAAIARKIAAPAAVVTPCVMPQRAVEVVPRTAAFARVCAAFKTIHRVAIWKR